jgi:hypothetical protein
LERVTNTGTRAGINYLDGKDCRKTEYKQAEAQMNGKVQK